MTSIDDGGPAFPIDVDTHEEGLLGIRRRGGLSLRDWFAGWALEGMIASSTIINAGTASPSIVDKARWTAEAYEFADAMLVARRGRRGTRS